MGCPFFMAPAPPVWPLLLAVIVLPAGAMAVVLLALSLKFRHAKRKQARVLSIVGAVMVSVAVLGSVVALGDWAGFEDQRTRFRFEYHVILEPNGTGLVRVQLPAPLDGQFLEGFSVDSSSSSALVTGFGNETVLEVTLSSRTTVQAVLEGHVREGAGITIGLTRTGTPAECDPNAPCVTNIAMSVLSGTVQDVRFQLEARWDLPVCAYYIWRSEATLGPGEATYSGTWRAVAC
jgi:hypothetical protein